MTTTYTYSKDWIHDGAFMSLVCCFQACAVMALERVPADIRRQGGVARMTDPKVNPRPLTSELLCVVTDFHSNLKCRERQVDMNVRTIKST